MGPSNRRTTSISAAKLRSLRLMLLSRSRRHKSRNNCLSIAGNSVKINKYNINNNNNNNHSNILNNYTTIATAIAAATTTPTITLTNSHRGNRRSGGRVIAAKSKMQLNDEQLQEKSTFIAVVEPKSENLEQQDYQELQVNQAAKFDDIKQLNNNNENTSCATIINTITANSPITTLSSSTTSHSANSEKVFYDNRIKRKNVLALNEKVAAIREYEKMPVYKRIGRMFQCSPDQIKRIVQQKESILKAWEQRTRRCQDAKTLEMKVVRVSMLGKAVYDWMRRMMYYKDFMITDGLIQKMALQFKSAMGLQSFFPHQDWCDKFRQTYKIHEHDSKLLTIGYAQGHSVQIKDIIKDVLSEYTPDRRNDESVDLELPHSPAKQFKLSVKCLKQEHRTDENAAIIPTASKVVTTATTITSSNTALNLSKAAVRHLQLPQLVTLPRGLGSMPQKILVATPISNPSAAAAVGRQRACSNNTTAVSANISSSTPMTMTIIPLATITQPLGGTAAGSLIAANTKRNGRVVPTPMIEIKREIKEERRDEDEQRRQIPIAIKQELFSDDEVDNGQKLNDVDVDFNADADEQDAEVFSARAPNKINLIRATKPTISATVTTIAATAKRRDPSPAGGDDTMDSMDYENLALSSLKKIIQNKAAANAEATINVLGTAAAKYKNTIIKTNATMTTANTNNATTVGSTETATTALTATSTATTMAKITMKNTTLTLTPIETLRATSLPLPPMVALSQFTRVPAQLHTKNRSVHLPPMPPLQLLPQLTKAPVNNIANTSNTQQPLPALIPRTYSTNILQSASSSAAPLYSMGYRLPQKRKMLQENGTSYYLSPIKTCAEARRYLKLLEDFALLRENFRLMGLITRADEVLRELDGDDDVDVD